MRLELQDCWNTIGVSGDHSCTELREVVHCRNCPVYAAAGRGLLDRKVPEGYQDEWTELLAARKEIGSLERLSVVIFRLQAEWLALPTRIFSEVTVPRVVHTLPHRRDPVLLGLVNIRGELQLCISLGSLLQLETSAAPRPRSGARRMVVVEWEEDRWVFPVDEIHGVYRATPHEFQNVPATISKAPDSYTRFLLPWRETRVSLLDEDLLFSTLHRTVFP